MHLIIQIPAFGYGAKLHGSSKSSNAFPLSMKLSLDSA